MEESSSDSKFTDALSSHLPDSSDEYITTKYSSLTQETQDVSSHLFIASKNNFINASQSKGSTLHLQRVSSGENDNYSNCSPSFKEVHNSTPQKVDIESQSKRVEMSLDYDFSGNGTKCEDGEMLTNSVENKPSNQVSGVKFGAMGLTSTNVGIMLDTNSNDQELVVGTIKFPGAEKWGGVKSNSSTITPQEKSPCISNYSEELTTPKTPSIASKAPSIASKAPSIASRTVTAKSEPPPDNEPDHLVLKAAADCLHAQDFTRMVEILDSVTNGTSAVLFGRGLAYYRLKKYPEAIQNFIAMDNHVATLHLSQHSNTYLAQYYLGEIKLTCKNFKEAAKHYEKAAKSHSSDTVAKSYNMVQPSLASIYSKQGSAFRQAQLVMEAVQAYKSALTYANNRKDELAAHTSLGNLYQSLGENKSAIEHYESTIRLADELGDYMSLGWAYGNMGNAWLGLYEKNKALNFLKKALKLTIQYEPTPQAIGRAYNNLGTAFQSINDLDKAREYYDMALNQAIYGMDEAGEARVRGNIGNLMMIQKNFDSAISHYTETLSIAKDRSTKCTAYHNRGCASYEKTELERKKIKGHKSSNGKSEFHVTFNGPSVENEPRDHALPASLKVGYRKAQEDFSLVVQYHEETFQTMRGSPQGLNLSVSLFETNSRSFYRLQDCLYNLQEWWVALEYAEQSRARTLGELLLQRKYGQLPLELIAPLRVEQIQKIINYVRKIVVYISYTGARLLTWVFVPCAGGKIITNMFQVAVEDDQFDGKSLDYYLRFLLADELDEEGMQMYGRYRYEKSPALSKLYRLFARPLLTILDNINDNKDRHTSIRDIIVIPDSYTSLMPIFALFEDGNDNNFHRQFLGDRFCFRIMPSFLTLGILSQLPPATVFVPKDSLKFCIVGNPSIPTFNYRGETWNMGKLPFAAKEAESVAHILRCSPTLHEEATKNVVMSMFLEAKVVHLATHGSSSSGFLAFASHGSSRTGAMADEKSVLLYPEEVEKLNISPALVVLSSCDSGRGMVKADGVQGMARAFILAGAQAVLTALWRVPDESAAIFMNFFYQYMMDGFKSSHALQKAILSIRSFQKYSKYIHWSGYQLTGQEVEFSVKKRETKIGPCPVFPRLEIVRSLEKAFVKDCYLPTDVQIIHGAHGLRSAEPVLQFVANNYTHFPGGVFYVPGYNFHFLHGAEQMIREELSKCSQLEDEESHALLIFDGLLDLPSPSSFLKTLTQRNKTHIIFIIEENPFSSENLERQVDMALLRGTDKTKLLPLSELHVTQRLVYGIMTKCEFAPYSREQDILINVAERSLGSSDLVDVISALLSRYIDEDEEESTDGFVERFYLEVWCGDGSSSCSQSYINSNLDEEKGTKEEGKAVEGLDTTVKKYVNEKKEETDHKKGENGQHIGNNGGQPSKNEFIYQLINGFHLSKADFVFLSTLSLFGSAPLPRCLVEQVQMIVQEACSDLRSIKTPLEILLSASLLNHFPSPVITRPFSHLSPPLSLTESSLFHIPLIISKAIQESMDPKDMVFSLSTANLGLCCVRMKSGDKSLILFLAGLAQILLAVAKKHDEVIYRKIFQTYLSLINRSCVM